MGSLSHHFNGRERNSIILLSAILFVYTAVMLVIDSKRPAPEPTPQQPYGQATSDSCDYLSPPSDGQQSQPLHSRKYPDRPITAARGNRASADPASGTSVTHERQYPASDKFTTLTPVDPNTADSVTLTRIPGIGRYTAQSIIRQRQRLGGFHSVKQLTTCKYFRPELLKWFAIGNHPTLRRFNINTADFRTLISHPYIDRNQTLDILSYRRLHGTIPDSAALLSTSIFSAEELADIAPYIEY